MNIPVEVVIAFLGLVAASIFGVTTAAGNLRKEARADGAQHGNIEQKIDNMLTILTDVKAELSGIKRDNVDNRERIVKIEANADNLCKAVESLHKRVRSIEAYIPIMKEIANEQN